MRQRCLTPKSHFLKNLAFINFVIIKFEANMIKGQLKRIYKFNNRLNIKMEMHMSINLYIYQTYIRLIF